MIRNIYIITFLIINSIFSINAQESNIWLEFDADEITIREGSFMKSFTYKKEKNCGGNIRFSHQIKVSDF